MNVSFEVLNDSMLGFSGVFASKMKIYSYHTHTHLYYEMLLYEPFDGNITINDQELKITEPTAILIAPGDLHSTNLCGKPSYVYKMQCNSICLEKNYLTSILSVHRTDNMINELFSAGIKYKENKDYLLSVIRMTASEIAFHGNALSDSVSGEKWLVSKTMQYINRNFQKNIGLTDAANEQYVTPQYLSSVFSKTAGITFQNYLVEKRLSVAAALLQKGKYSITDVCYECGYRNLSHFIRSFKNKYGMSPVNYRESRNHNL